MSHAAKKKPSPAPGRATSAPLGEKQEIELEVDTLTNLGEGLGRAEIPSPGAFEAATAPGDPVSGTAGPPAPSRWVVMLPFALPGERVVARVWHNAANFSRADLVRVLRPSPARVEPRCPLFGRCGGCQYQNLAYPEQLAWKTRITAELLKRLGGVEFPVSPCHPSPRQYNYRTKITPHFYRADAEIGFLAAGRRRIVDVPACPIATEAVNDALPRVREETRANASRHKRGATLLVRETATGVVTDFRATALETLGTLRLRFPAGDFFQNNPFILPDFTAYAIRAASGGGECAHLLDTYCGSGLFALAGAPEFESVHGVEISPEAVANATENARANGISNAVFTAASADGIFDTGHQGARPLPPAGKTAVLMDPPRRGSDEAFLGQLLRYAPRRVVYVSCAPDTQMRDLRPLLSGGYEIEAVQPFDLFPQTRHIENIITLRRKTS
ncbi:MAG: class I SAM-dependent RNA methyltransferase [Puniceicoccales bacterium]|nr:class I SAM-dependent RNA methyltransferase [Puniceicoccales bacterium]